MSIASVDRVEAKIRRLQKERAANCANIESAMVDLREMTKAPSLTIRGAAAQNIQALVLRISELNIRNEGLDLEILTLSDFL